jgi:hypothetical protein
MRIGTAMWGLVALGLAACAQPGPGPGMPEAAAARPSEDLSDALRTDSPAARDGVCWHREDIPALYETVTESALRPSDDGVSIVESEQNQRLVRARRSVWFRVPCAGEQGTRFVASVQRALKARGLYAGPVTGIADAGTGVAVRRYQAPRGLESGVLSWRAAQLLGLVPVDPD